VKPKTASALAQLEEAMRAFAQALVDEQAPPEPPLGSVIRWQRTYPGSSRVYDWVAIRTHAGWYTSGRDTNSNHRLGWPGILRLAGGAKLYIATGWDELGERPAPEDDEPDYGVDPRLEFVYPSGASPSC
jgi:hypothetical protein